jgi:hypothetical protein
MMVRGSLIWIDKDHLGTWHSCCIRPFHKIAICTGPVVLQAAFDVLLDCIGRIVVPEPCRLVIIIYPAHGLVVDELGIIHLFHELWTHVHVILGSVYVHQGKTENHLGQLLPN